MGQTFFPQLDVQNIRGSTTTKNHLSEKGDDDGKGGKGEGSRAEGRRVGRRKACAKRKWGGDGGWWGTRWEGRRGRGFGRERVRGVQQVPPSDSPTHLLVTARTCRASSRAHTHTSRRGATTCVPSPRGRQERLGTQEGGPSCLFYCTFRGAVSAPESYVIILYPTHY